MTRWGIQRGTLVNDMIGDDQVGTNLKDIDTNTSHSKGSWQEVVSSTSQAADGIIVFCAPWSNYNERYLFDIAVGGSGSEEVIVENLVVDSRSFASVSGWTRYMPIHIPEGTRIAMRGQSSGGQRCSFGILLLGQGGHGPAPLCQCETLGADTSDSGGVTVIPGSSANSLGSWTSIGTTSDSWKFMGITAFRPSDGQNLSTPHYMYEVAIGSGGIPQETILSGLALYANANNDLIDPGWVGFPVDIPASTELFVRLQADGASQNNVDFIFYGFS